METYRDSSERGRLVEMSDRLTGAERVVSGVLLAALLLCVPTFGPLPAVLYACVSGASWYLLARLKYLRRPEVALAGWWILAELTVAAAVVVATGPRLYLLVLFAFPMLSANLVFPANIALRMAGLTVVIMVGTALIADPHELARAPFALIYPAAAIMAVALGTRAVRDADADTRMAALVDPLTGILNRVALEARSTELAYQASVNGRPVSVIVGDVDRFKAINDRHGHPIGDSVLIEVARRLVEGLGAGESVYRVGGEEFVVLLPDVAVADAASVAESLRAAIGTLPVGGVDVTMSFGVSGSEPGESFDYHRAFTRADAALTASKQSGRDRVTVAGSHGPPSLDASPALGAERGEELTGTVIRLRGRSAHESVSPPVGPAAPAVRVKQGGGTWLVRDTMLRNHILDLNRRQHRTNLPAYILTFAVVIAAAPTYGWITVFPPLVGALLYDFVENRLERFPTPEYVLAGAWLIAQSANGAAAALVHLSSAHPPLYSLPLLAILIASTGAFFPGQAGLIGTGFAMLVTLLAAVCINPALAAADPGIVAVAVTLVGGAGLVSLSAGRAALGYRGVAIVDQLTGMLNRAALATRVAELSYRAPALGPGVSVIVVDLDGFKAVNDLHGHAAGDKVLQETADRIRTGLRDFDSVYRVGGEEFVILLPDVGLDAAWLAAERLREAVRATPIAGLPISVSAGVASSVPGRAFDYPETLRRADGALYQAKRAGRNQVLSDRDGRLVPAA